MTEVVTLHVGDRTFKTQKATLLKIPYFNDYFSEKTGTEPRLDGTYFVDLDGGTFEHSKLVPYHELSHSRDGC